MAMALVAPINHDEDQYVAAAVLAGRLVIYRDFASLQAPLHAFVFAPLALLRPDAFIAMRLASALVATALLWSVYVIQRRRGVMPAAALATSLLLLSCTSFHIAATLVRNDALPALAMTMALGLVLDCEECVPRFALLAGLCIGLAISAKVSYAPFALLLCLGVWCETRSWRIMAATVAGLLIGLLPLLWCWLRAPVQFWWGVVQFARIGPDLFYAQGGNGVWLTPQGKLLRLALAAAEGPALAGLLLLLGDRWRRRGEPLSHSAGWLARFLVAGGLAAFIPTPSWRQYLLPLLPPLFVALGLMLQRRPPWSAAVKPVLLLFALVGLARPARDLVEAAAHGNPLLANALVSREISQILKEHHSQGPILSASIHAILDTDRAFDLRLATGVFVLRSPGLVPVGKAPALHVLAPETLAADLDTDPPPVIVTGLDPPSDLLDRPQDEILTRYAMMRNYLAIGLPSGGRVLIGERAPDRGAPARNR
jgi:hypothetical protein